MNFHTPKTSFRISRNRNLARSSRHNSPYRKESRNMSTHLKFSKNVLDSQNFGIKIANMKKLGYQSMRRRRTASQGERRRSESRGSVSIRKCLEDIRKRKNFKLRNSLQEKKFEKQLKGKNIQIFNFLNQKNNVKSSSVKSKNFWWSFFQDSSTL